MATGDEAAEQPVPSNGQQQTPMKSEAGEAKRHQVPSVLSQPLVSPAQESLLRPKCGILCYLITCCLVTQHIIN